MPDVYERYWTFSTVIFCSEQTNLFVNQRGRRQGIYKQLNACPNTHRPHRFTSNFSSNSSFSIAMSTVRDFNFYWSNINKVSVFTWTWGQVWPLNVSRMPHLYSHLYPLKATILARNKIRLRGKLYTLSIDRFVCLITFVCIRNVVKIKKGSTWLFPVVYFCLSDEHRLRWLL